MYVCVCVSVYDVCVCVCVCVHTRVRVLMLRGCMVKGGKCVGERVAPVNNYYKVSIVTNFFRHVELVSILCQTTEVCATQSIADKPHIQFELVST